MVIADVPHVTLVGVPSSGAARTMSLMPTRLRRRISDLVGAA
jgi:hypothetical protein